MKLETALSPGKMIGYQARRENQVRGALLAALGGFLSTLHAAVMDGGFTAAVVADAWEDLTDRVASRLPDEDGHAIRAALARDGMPSTVYDGVTAVVAYAATAGLSRDAFAAELDEALSLDSAEAQVQPGTPRAGEVSGATAAVLGTVGMTWRERALQTSRTATTGLVGGLAKDVLEANGIEGKRWVSMRDKRTRDTHIAADGQVVALGGLFQVGYDQLQYPGDPVGSPEEIFNCRCVVVGVLPEDYRYLP